LRIIAIPLGHVAYMHVSRTVRHEHYGEIPERVLRIVSIEDPSILREFVTLNARVEHAGAAYPFPARTAALKVNQEFRRSERSAKEEAVWCPEGAVRVALRMDLNPAPSRMTAGMHWIAGNLLLRSQAARSG
jgi:hypothetical protein